MYTNIYIVHIKVHLGFQALRWLSAAELHLVHVCVRFLLLPYFVSVTTTVALLSPLLRLGGKTVMTAARILA